MRKLTKDDIEDGIAAIILSAVILLADSMADLGAEAITGFIELLERITK